MSLDKNHNYSSFSYKVTNGKIQGALRSRSNVSNAVQVGMPFVKVTSTIEVPEILGANNIGFTIGPHGLFDAQYQTIYNPTKSAPYLGYTYTPNGTNEPVYANVNGIAEQIANFFTPDIKLQNTSLAKNKMPPPGITGVKIGTNRSGLSATAEIQISVPSLQQLEYLNKVFLIPGCGMVVEWGQQFAKYGSADFGENGLYEIKDEQGKVVTPLQEKLFPWYDRTTLKELLTRLGKRQVGLDEILEKYVYSTEGQYMWMFGRVANIATQGNQDGSFDITVTLKGPSEDQWAYSVRQTVSPSSGPNDVPCASNANSIETYLTNDTPNYVNLKNVLEAAKDVSYMPGTETEIQKDLSGWRGHVIPIGKGNDNADGEQSTGEQDQEGFADSKDAYFMTWRFFVNVVLNHSKYGIKSIFKNANLPDEVVEKMGIIRPIRDPELSKDSYENFAGPEYLGLKDPYENYVGNNRWLLSIDPGTMLIINKTAKDANVELLTSTEAGGDLLAGEDEDIKFESRGDFLFSAGTLDADEIDKGLLSTGVWLNHKAVVSSLLSANTLMEGISNLLGKMNNATRGFWALTLDTSIPATPADKYEYTIVDQNYRASSNTAITELLNGTPPIYTFNKFLRESRSGIVGSELTEFSVNLDLPKLLFSQIATLGISDPDDAKAASSQTPILNPCGQANISDANDNLRRLIGISSISPGRNGKSIDLTNISTPKQSGECSGTPNAAPGGAAGPRPATSKVGEGEGSWWRDTAIEGWVKEQKEAEEYLKDPANKCDGCTPCYEPLPSAGAVSVAGVTQHPAPGTDPEKIIPIFASVRSQWQDKKVARTWTKLTFEEAFKILQDMGCSDTLTISIMAAMSNEQGAPGGYAAANFNFSGVDLGNSPVAFDPKYHSGWMYGLEGNKTRKVKPYVAFHDAYRALHFKATAFKRKAEKLSRTVNGTVVRLDQPELLTAEQYAELYYVQWNGCGFRDALTPENGLTGKPYGACSLAIKNEFPSSREDFRKWDAEGLKRARTQYTNVLNKFRSQLKGRKTTAIRPLTGPPPTTATPTTSTAPTAPATSQPTCPDAKKTECGECMKRDNLIRVNDRKIQDERVLKAAASSTDRSYSNLNKSINYFERLPDRMLSLIRCSADGNKANAFGTAPGSLSIKAEMTMPGIAGLRVGELFWIDRIPAFYKIFGAFQIMSIEQVVSQDVWQTKISAQFNTLGNAWKNDMMRRMQSSNIFVI